MSYLFIIQYIGTYIDYKLYLNTLCELLPVSILNKLYLSVNVVFITLDCIAYDNNKLI